MGHFTRSLPSRVTFTRDDDCSFRSFARYYGHLGSRPVNTFPRAIIAQPCLTTRWRTSLTEIQNHLSRVTAGRGRHDGFRIGERRGHFPSFFLFVNRLTEKKEYIRLTDKKRG